MKNCQNENDVITSTSCNVLPKRFEYDKNKSENNKIKHRVDFEEAQLLWEDCDRVEITIQSENEQRYLTIGLMHNKHWTAIITYRGLNIRLISVRRSREEEVEIYENGRL